jgi:hypothetical protein
VRLKAGGHSHKVAQRGKSCVRGNIWRLTIPRPEYMSTCSNLCSWQRRLYGNIDPLTEGRVMADTDRSKIGGCLSNVYLMIPLDKDRDLHFEFGARNRIKTLGETSSPMPILLFRSDRHHCKSGFLGVTVIRDFELPPKSPGAPDPPRSLATNICRPIRVRHPYFSRDFGSIPSLSDRPRSSPTIAN